MSDTFIILDEPSVTDKKLDAENVDGGSPPLVRERVQVTGAALAEVARVQNSTPAGTEYGLVVRAADLPPGAATAAKQPALGTAGTPSADVITIQGKAAMTPVLVDGSAVTQPVSAASLPLPTGASTAAKQPALGTAGTPSADVISVQGVASMTALKVDGSAVTQPVSGSVTANAGTNLNTSALALESGGNLATLAGAVKAEDAASANADTGIPVLAVRKATPANTSGTDGDYENLQVSAGRLWASATIDAALPAGTNAIGKLAANSGVDIGDVDVTSVIPGTGATNLGKAEDAAHSSGDAGVMALAVRQSTPTDLSAGATNGDYEPIQVGKNGGAWVSCSAEARGGVSVATGSIGATKTDIGTANTPGGVYGWYIYNPNASAVYVQFFNAQASAVTLGTTAPVYSIGIPATSGANVLNPMPIDHATAICIAITTTRAGSTGPASTVDYNIFYKQ